MFSNVECAQARSIWIQSHVGSYQCDINPVICFDDHVTIQSYMLTIII